MQGSEMFGRWELERNPFYTLPPRDKNIRRQVFTGRESELDDLMRYCRENRGIYLSGIYGSGKTMICYELQNRLDSRKIDSVYSIYQPQYGFMKTILLHTAEHLGGKTGNLVEKIIRGYAISKQEVMGSEYEGSLFQILKAKVMASSSEQVNITIEDPFLWFKDIIAPYHDNLIVIMVEDMDKVERKESINDIVLTVRQLIQDEKFNIAIIITGHPVGLIRGFGSHSDILYPVHMKNFTFDCYKEMCRNYLNSARRQESKYYNSFHPFEEELVNWLAGRFGGLALTPRLFNSACFHILEKAVDMRTEKVGINNGKSHLANKYIELFGTLKQDDKLFLKAVYDSGGVLDEDNRELIEKITDNRFASLSQVVFRAIELEKMEDKGLPLLSRQISDDGNTLFKSTGLELPEFAEVVKNYIPENKKT